MPRLEFSHVHSYDSRLEGITLPPTLRSAGERVNLLAQVDTGASNCLFQREHGEMLNLDIESGDSKTFATAAGRIDAFGHVVSLEVLEQRFESMVYFFAERRIRKNLLGRVGWLDRVRLGVVDHDHLLYLAEYDFEAH
jgi:predicted aspartyl protease